MKRFIWKFRYARHMYKKSSMSWSYCWESACISTEECGDDWVDEEPEDVAQEEMECWSD